MFEIWLEANGWELVADDTWHKRFDNGDVTVVIPDTDTKGRRDALRTLAHAEGKRQYEVLREIIDMFGEVLKNLPDLPRKKP